MRIYGLKKKYFDAILRILQRNLKNTGAVAYLFGSRSRGDNRLNSDIDILVHKKKEDIKEKLVRLENDLLESEVPFKFDLVDEKDLASEYRENIKSDKKVLWRDGMQVSKWRICPVGQHWVSRHLRTTSSGSTTEVDGHCRKNPSDKEVLNAAEMDEIIKLSAFKNAKPKVVAKTLGFSGGNQYNVLISGWTAFWNDVFQPEEKLPPNFVKALIASESGFDSSSKAKNKLKVGDAQGLIQLTKQTQKILKNRKGELRNYYIDLSKNDIWEANKNIAAAIRWLFRKQETAKARLKRQPTWEEVLWEYKGILTQKGKKAMQIKKQLRSYLDQLEE